MHSNIKYNNPKQLNPNGTITNGSKANTSSTILYKKRPEGFDQLKSGGRVIIEDNVDIGALCTIDKGVTGDTKIGEGSKLDNQIQIGHDTIIGKKCLIASQTGIAGCCIIEDDVTIWGQVGTTSGITIGEKAIILGQTGVSKSIEGGKSYFGTPIGESRVKLKELALIKKIPSILEHLKKK